MTPAGLEVIVGLGYKEIGHDICMRRAEDVPAKSPTASNIDSCQPKWRSSESPETRESQEVAPVGLVFIVGLGCLETGRDTCMLSVEDVPAKFPTSSNIDSYQPKWRS